MPDLFPTPLKDTLSGQSCCVGTQRVLRNTLLPVEANALMSSRFASFGSEWDSLVDRDRSGVKIRRRSQVEREYLNRRKLSRNPLRKRPHSRLVSIPVDSSTKKELKEWLQIDWRRVQKPRIHRRGGSYVLSYVELASVQIPEPNRFKYDVGLCLSEEGLTIRLQSPNDTAVSRVIPKSILTKELINQLVHQMARSCRVIALDPTVPSSMIGTKRHLVRRIRTTQAEGATVFRSPKRVSMGEKYLDLPKSNPNHLKLWHRKAMAEWNGYSLMLGLTGEPLLVREHDGRLVTGPMDKSVNPVLRANDVLQTALAKLDLWHTATTMSRKDRKRVRSAFHRLLLRTTATIKL